MMWAKVVENGIQICREDGPNCIPVVGVYPDLEEGCKYVGPVQYKLSADEQYVEAIYETEPVPIEQPTMDDRLSILEKRIGKVSDDQVLIEKIRAAVASEAPNSALRKLANALTGDEPGSPGVPSRPNN
jgi:hypothetical protein